MVLGPVAMANVWVSKSSTLRLEATVSAWLICNSMFEALAVRPSTPTKPAEAIVACSATHSRAGLL